jgi:4-hydroxy-2-oxovalerate aldolase
MSDHLRITDTTLRDGSHAMAHQFTEEQVRATVHALDAAGVEVIEVTHGDGLGGSSFNYGFSRVDEIALIAAGVEEATQAKIAVLLVPGIGTKDDLRNSREAGASVARIATHCTEADVSIQHFGLARDLGMETVGFLMMAHKTSPEELARQARIMVDAGAECVYCVDSAGALVLGDAQERIKAMYAEVGHQAEIGFHGHQNLSLGVANSVLAYQHGARQVDGALCALGAGAGNSPPRCWPPPSTTSACGPAWTWAACWPRPRKWSGRSCPAGPRWTGPRSCRAGPGSTAASCCTPNGLPSATASPPTRSCSEPASSATSAARRT